MLDVKVDRLVVVSMCRVRGQMVEWCSRRNCFADESRELRVERKSA